MKELRELINQARKKFFKQISEEIKAKEENFELYLKDYIKEKDISDTSTLKYEDLAPKDTVEKGEEVYISSLDWALSQDKIHNIALTGPYGSGKSTILKSYQNKRNQYKYLNISLASFNCTSIKNEESDKSKDSSEELVKFDELEIEKGVLKQIFYKVKSSKIPYSRYRKIRNISLIKSTAWLLAACITFIVGGELINPNLFKKFNSCHGYIFIAMFSIVGAITYRYFNAQIHINKLCFDKLGIEKDKANDESAFNKYLDEILYYFEVTNYDVVVIEDLDRFKNTKIFIKLRELNSLINNSEQINKKVVFIYAIKDDMFKDKDRTKFFEYIIPVIPVIDATNSGDKLREKIEKMGYEDKIGTEYINGISVYIDDMRTLTNICNEFQMYKNVLTDVNLKDEKMFSIIVYKNIYPDDFAKLQYGEGLVYRAFEGKKQFKKEHIKVLKKEQETMQERLKNVESDVVSSVKELKAALIYNMVGGFEDISTIGGHNISEIMEDSFDLNEFKDDDLLVNYHYKSNRYCSLEDADSKSGTEKTYLERWKYLKAMTPKLKEDINKKIEESKMRQNTLKGKSLKELFDDYDANEILSSDITRKKPILYLLRNGYIDETYENYLTYFYENSISASDMEFILSIRNHEKLEFKYELSKDKMEQIIYRLNDYEFKQVEILNFDLLEYLIENKNLYEEKIKIILNVIAYKLKSDIKYNFIDGFYETRQDSNSIFFKMLCHEWNEIWFDITSKQNFSKNNVEEYIKRIIKDADIEDIKGMNQIITDSIGDKSYEKYPDYFDECIKNKIPNFLELTKDIEFERLKEIIDGLSINFGDIYTYLSGRYTPYTERLNYIFNNNHYQINVKMLKRIYEFKSNGNTVKFDKSNFTAILELGYEALISYIQDNFKEYITNVFLKLENNTEESLQSTVKILNNSSLAEELEIKLEIIKKENFQIEDLELVGQDLWDEILKEDKIKPLWKCVYQYFLLKGKINDILNEYIQRNFKQLVVSKDINIEPSDDNIKQQFLRELLYIDFTNECYESIVRAVNFKINPDIGRLDESQMKILIKLHYFQLTADTFNTIKQRFPNMQIDYVISYKAEFIKRLDEIKLKNDDVEMLLNKPEFSPREKIAIVNKSLDGAITENIAKQILSVLEYYTEIPGELVKAVWEALTDRHDRIRLFTKQLHNMQPNNITEYLNELGDEFSEIPQSDKIVEIEYSNVVFALAKELASIEYISSCGINEKEDPETKQVQKYVQFSPKTKAEAEIED